MKLNITVIFCFLFALFGLQAQTNLTIDLSQRGIHVSPTHYGIFFEDINHAADGGLYAELIKNRSFEDATTIDPWFATTTNNASETLTLDKTNPLNNFQTNSLKMNVTNASANARAGVCNPGYWGINVVEGQQYKLTFFAKANTGFTGSITASLENSSNLMYAETVVPGLTDQWQKFTCILNARGSYPNAQLVLSVNSIGTIWFDVVSLFPPTYKDRPNGLRPDLAKMLADLHPKFMRFPGGCFVEGDYLANRFQWKNTIGNIENRPGHYNLWGYRTTDGMGYHEFLQLAEDIGAEPLYVFNIGVAHNDFVIYNQINSYIQDALDAIEYANGDVTTTYGAMRAANGHPLPFNLKYVEVGNENSGNDHYADRFYQFYNALKAKYPTLKFVADGDGTSVDFPTFKVSGSTDFLDEHYYQSPQWFMSQAFKYESYSRTGPKVYVGEYAVTSGSGYGNLSAALGEAAYMTGMENNSDIVPMNSYAPLLVNVNDRKWNPDLINFNSSSVYGTPSYYVQSLFANNLGDVIIPVKDSLVSTGTTTVSGSIGLGTWATAADYSNVQVINGKGNVLFSDQFVTGNNWTPGTGTWSVSNGIYTQSSTLTDCRSIAAVISDSVYTYSLKARKTSGNEGFLIIFGYKDSNNFYWWNIGGWGNTQHAIEQCVGGSKSILTSVPGSVSSNQWYDIKIVFSKDRTLFYLDNVLIHTLRNGSKFLFSSASLDTAGMNLFLKVVNTSSNPLNSIINLQNLNTNVINGTVTELTSSNISDENSITNPVNVVPVTSSIYSDKSLLNFTFKANSINVFKLKVDIKSAINQLSASSNNFNIYPTFTHNNVIIKNTSEKKYQVNVLDLNGHQLISTEVTDVLKLDLSNLNTGVYLIRVTSSEKVFVTKVVKY